MFIAAFYFKIADINGSISFRIITTTSDTFGHIILAPMTHPNKGITVFSHPSDGNLDKGKYRKQWG